MTENHTTPTPQLLVSVSEDGKQIVCNDPVTKTTIHFPLPMLEQLAEALPSLRKEAQTRVAVSDYRIAMIEYSNLLRDWPVLGPPGSTRYAAPVLDAWHNLGFDDSRFDDVRPQRALKLAQLARQLRLEPPTYTHDPKTFPRSEAYEQAELVIATARLNIRVTVYEPVADFEAAGFINTWKDGDDA